MASISSSFHCLSSSAAPNARPSSSSSSFPPVTRVRFQKSRPISAVCVTAPVAERSTASFYDVLGIQSGASCQEIKAAYRKLARVLHPDVVGPNDVTSASDFIRVHEAYATLSDPGKRAEYDRAVLLRRRSVNGSSPFVNSVGMCNGRARGPSGTRFTRRSWETDQCW